MAEKYGVKEYWVIDTTYNVVKVFNFGLEADKSRSFSMSETVQSMLEELQDFKITVSDIFSI